MTGDPNPPDPWRNASFPQHAYVGSPTNQGGTGRWDAWNQNQSVHANANRNAPCPACGMYYQDHGFSVSVQIQVPMMVVPCPQIPTRTPAKPISSMPSPERSGVVFPASLREGIAGSEKVERAERLHMPPSCHHRLLRGVKVVPIRRVVFVGRIPKINPVK